MYLKKDDTICYLCSRGLTCRKHAFKKQKVIKAKDFTDQELGVHDSWSSDSLEK